MMNSAVGLAVGFGTSWMHPQAPASGATSAPTDPAQALAAHLDSVMAEAEIAANAQRDVEAEASNPSAPSTRQETPAKESEGEAPPATDGSVPAEEAPEEPDDEDEEAAEEEEAEEAPPAQPTAEQPKYSRRDAARFASELEASKTELEQTRSQLEGHAGELASLKSADHRIRNHLQTQSGYVKEQNGRFRYENLSEKVLKGTASPEEAEEVAQMTAWHEFAAPIFRAAEELTLGSFVADWNKLADLEGVGAEGLKKLNVAANTVAGAKELHAMALAAGEAKAKKASEATIAKLRAEVKSLRTTQVARAPQPASSNGAAVPGKGGILARMIDPTTGLPNPEFDREVAQGKWLGVDLSQQT